MARTRRTYTPEFKVEAVKLVTEQGYSVAEAARSLGIHCQHPGPDGHGILARPPGGIVFVQLHCRHWTTTASVTDPRAACRSSDFESIIASRRSAPAIRPFSNLSRLALYPRRVLDHYLLLLKSF